jgi:hypothetical protein
MCNVVKLHTHDFDHDQQHLTCRQLNARVTYTIISHSTNRHPGNTLQYCDWNILTSSASKSNSSTQHPTLLLEIARRHKEQYAVLHLA